MDEHLQCIVQGPHLFGVKIWVSCAPSKMLLQVGGRPVFQHRISRTRPGGGKMSFIGFGPKRFWGSVSTLLNKVKKRGPGCWLETEPFQSRMRMSLMRMRTRMVMMMMMIHTLAKPCSMSLSHVFGSLFLISRLLLVPSDDDDDDDDADDEHEHEDEHEHDEDEVCGHIIYQ